MWRLILMGLGGLAISLVGACSSLGDSAVRVPGYCTMREWRGEPAETIREVHYSYQEDGATVEVLAAETRGVQSGWSCVFHYDSAGNPLDADCLDRGVEGRSYAEFSYAASGVLISEVYTQYDSDGNLQITTTNRFDGQGRAEESTTTDGSGEPIVRSVYHYDEQGRRTLTERFEPNSGSAPTQLTHYEYAENTVVISKDSDADGDFDSREIEFENDDGQPIRIEYDWENDGVPDLIMTSTYDEAGRIIVIATETSNPDGSWSTSHEYRRYDDEGNLTAINRDGNGDGASEEGALYLYDCQP